MLCVYFDQFSVKTLTVSLMQQLAADFCLLVSSNWLLTDTTLILQPD